MLTKENAQILCEAWEVDMVLSTKEERELLEENNPDLLEAYRELFRVANPE